MDADLLSLMLEAAVAILLVAALAYGYRLNRNLNAVRSGREDFEKLLKDFTTSTERAEKALADLRTGSEKRLGEIGGQVGKAQSVADDLEFLIKRGEAVADRLDAGVRGEPSPPTPRTEVGGGSSREETAAPDTGPGSSEADRQREKAKAKSKSELLKALQDMR